MRRYTSLLLTAFTLLIVVLLGAAYLAKADHSQPRKAMREIVVYTTLPAENAALLSEAYEKEHKIRVVFVPLSREEILNRVKMATDKQEVPACLLIADAETLRRANKAEAFQPQMSESIDAVSNDFKEVDGRWVGLWYDPVVFCANRDYLRTLKEDVPTTWTELAARPNVRIGVTDFLAADAAANVFLSTIAQFGDVTAYQIWRQIHPKVVQYAKYLSNPVRQAGMGEVDISIAVQSETLRYINEGYPLNIIYPAEGTAYMMTGAGVLGKATKEDAHAAADFVDWLLSDEAQLTLKRKGFYFVPTNPNSLSYKTFPGKNMVLFTQLPHFTKDEEHDLLDRWMKYIRFQ